MAKKLSTLSTGVVVYLNVNGVKKNFIVVHQGNPDSSIYDSSCDGTWLLMVNSYENRVWNSSLNNDYTTSEIHSYLNNTFYNLLDSDVQNVIKQVKIPYIVPSKRSDGTVMSGADGLSTKIFLLSSRESGETWSYDTALLGEGAILDLFSTSSDYLITGDYFWLRSPGYRSTSTVYTVDADGLRNTLNTNNTLGVRPALILPGDLMYESGYLVFNTAPTTPGTPIPSSDLKTNREITVSWSAATDVDGDAITYELEYSLNASGSYTNIYTGTNTSTTCVIPSGTESIIFRVRAHDTSNAYSSYATSATLAVADIPIAFVGNVTIGGVAKTMLGEGYVNIGGIWKPLVESYANVNGVWLPMYPQGTEIGSLSVGSSVFMSVGGTSTEFIVVNQGNPNSSIYDSSCNGTWLLMKDIYLNRAWDSTDNDYANSDIHSYLNNTFVNLFDSDIESVIKQVKIPYTKGTGPSGTVSVGSDGLSAKVFLLSYTEVGFSGSSYAKVEGSVLSYFNDSVNSKRVAKLNGSAAAWWIRSPQFYAAGSGLYVQSDGSFYYRDYVTASNGVRPALIIPSTTIIDDGNSGITTTDTGFGNPEYEPV